MYKQRDDLLRSKGYASYDSYLKSRYWKKAKSLIGVGNALCVCCTNVSETAHHRIYTEHNLFPKTVEDIGYTLVPICNRCHGEIECDNHGRKIYSVSKIEARLKSRIRKPLKNVRVHRKQKRKQVKYSGMCPGCGVRPPMVIYEGELICQVCKYNRQRMTCVICGNPYKQTKKHSACCVCRKEIRDQQKREKLPSKRKKRRSKLHSKVGSNHGGYEQFEPICGKVEPIPVTKPKPGTLLGLSSFINRRSIK